MLLCANVAGLISTYYFNHNWLYGLVPLFDFDAEKNVPTLYSSMALIFVSIQAVYIVFKAKACNLSYIPWLGLSIIFLFLSIDEFSSIHERLTVPMREITGATGLLYYAWVIPYGIALLVFLSAYLKFLLGLPRDIMVLFLIAGGTFVLGAIGFELIGGSHAERHGQNNILYALITTAEELLEMLGVAVFIYALFLFMVRQFTSVSITVAE